MPLDAWMPALDVSIFYKSNQGIASIYCHFQLKYRFRFYPDFPRKEHVSRYPEAFCRPGCNPVCP